MFPSKPKFLQAAYEEETKDPYRCLFSFFHPNSPEFARVCGNVLPYDLLKELCCLYILTLYGMGGGGGIHPPGSFLLITLKRLNGFE